MINKKSIIIAAILTVLTTSFTAADATTGSNNLLQMDVKRSSAVDSVDVTFYTTGDSQNTIVTRKSPNRYVVLLPNVAGSSSIVPSLGGVKDLITDVQVKNVNDGIGGYTKITFGTTKPVNIKTYMKKTAPLTQAQKDYKNLIAQNNKTAAKPQAKPVEQKTAATAPKQSTTHTQTQKQQTKPVQTNEVKVTNKTNTQNNNKQLSLPKISFTPINVQNAKTEQQKASQPPKTLQQKTQEKIQEPKTVNTTSLTESNYVPKMKFDANGKREIDLEPRVTHEIVKEKQTKSVKIDPTFEIPEENQIQNQNNSIQDQSNAEETPQTEESSNFHLPIWLMAISGAALGLLILFLVFDAVSHAAEKDADRLKSFFNISSKNQARRRRREFHDIINDDNLNWQEKYKKYTETDRKLHPVKQSNDMSYVTDMSASKKAFIEKSENIAGKGFESDRRKLKNETLNQNLSNETQNTSNISSDVQNTYKQPTALNFRQVTDSIQNIPKDKTEEIKENLRAKISQMEHSLANTPQMEPPEEVSNDVKSEDDSIMGTFHDIKLKSFAKTVTLKETHRSLIEDDKKQTRNKSYKEGRFVKLKNSPLSVNRRKSASSDLTVSDLVNTGNRYLNNSNGEMKMDKQNENYLLSSLDEYMSILDSEEEKRTLTMQKDTVAETLSQVRPSETMSRSGITNPISRASNPMNRQKNEPTHYMNGLIVKSGYNIDAEKGFYVVNLDGVSALVGRIKDDIFILKKFDYIVDKPLQVRLDYGSVYIVKVGGFKCLVDVSKNKMGTLIEI